MSSAEEPTLHAPVERFKPTSGMLNGYAALLLAAVGLGYVALEVHTLVGLRVALALVVFGVLVWVTQLRPRATAYRDALLLKNSLVDVLIPLRLVDEVSVTRTLNVWVGAKRHVCIGIGRSMRSMFKGSKGGAAALLGAGRMHSYAEEANRPHPDQTAMAYETFVVTRIEELVAQAKSAPPPGTEERVRLLPAWPEIVALSVSTIAFVVSMLV